MMTPVPRCISLQTNAEVHFLTKRAFFPLVSHNPHIDYIHSLEEENILEKLKNESFDEIIDLHNNIRSRKFTSLLGVPKHRIRKLTLQKYLKIYTGIDVLPNGKHVSHRALDQVNFLDVEDDGKGMEVFLPDYPEENNEYICLALRTAKETKNIPLEKIEEIIERVNYPIYTLGGPEDADLGNQFEAKYPHVTNFAGKSDLEKSMQLVKYSKLLISGDTGMLHIACALKKPTVSIWGATIPEFGVFPYYGDEEVPHYISEVHLSCRPCSKHGTQKCPKKHFRCMHDQNVDKIVEFIDNYIPN